MIEAELPKHTNSLPSAEKTTKPYQVIKAIPLEKVKQARQDIAELDGTYEQIYYGTYYENKMDSDKYVRIAEVLDILDKLIESEVING